MPNDAHPCLRRHRFTRERSLVRNQPRPSASHGCTHSVSHAEVSHAGRIGSSGSDAHPEGYEQSVEQITGGKSQLDSLSDWPVEGILMHAAGQGTDGFRVVDVWESEEAAQAFGEQLGPVLAVSE